MSNNPIISSKKYIAYITTKGKVGIVSSESRVPSNIVGHMGVWGYDRADAKRRAEDTFIMQEQKQEQEMESNPVCSKRQCKLGGKKKKIKKNPHLSEHLDFLGHVNGLVARKIRRLLRDAGFYVAIVPSTKGSRYKEVYVVKGTGNKAYQYLKGVWW